MILDKLDTWQQLADDYLNHSPVAIHLGYIGDPGWMNPALDNLLTILEGQAIGYRQ